MPRNTIPSGDFTKQYGESLSIKCVIDLALAQGLNSSHIIFANGSKDLPRNLTRIIDERTAELYIEKPKPLNQMFYCKLKNPDTGADISVCMNFVTIGTPPQDPDDFHCVSHNWDNLLCEFHPKENYIQTNYSLQFYLPTTKNK
ncbi:interleukin-6 receptor subunit beta-like [Ctenocephalides felis]|uniref:interleukin-6 receptor subunit beta-like n=1 Tax=Ctenocephalides felis TaxID=7515 RepID=UPI000E6E1FBD|nr:interleukin-6 receptor subunit beta-like [Ctenocephalides felis]